MCKRYFVLVTFIVFLLATAANAFTITSQLTGDLRKDNPDFLFVDVTISVDELNSPSVASWTVDINSPAHPNTKLDAFYFNLSTPDTSPNTVSFSNFNPVHWVVTGDTSAQGAGLTFEFEVDKDNQQALDITNTQALTFDMTADFTLLPGTFLDAKISSFVGDNGDMIGGQLGAHLQSLEMSDVNNTDSGFAVGSYTSGGGPGQDYPIPEPSTLILLGGGLIGLVAYRRKKH